MYKKVDIQGGDMTFGQRIELGQILTDALLSPLDKFEKVFQCLHEFIPIPEEYSKHVDYYSEILKGLEFWAQKENELLHYEPTPKEKRAGIKDLAAKTGEFGTIKALAKAYNKDPDDILLWKYGKVFGILYTDLEEYKYHLRYSELK